MPKPRSLAPPAPRTSQTPTSNRDLAKLALSRRLSKILQDRDMNQSDLARAADLPRELISTYMRGRSWPTPLSLKRITRALGFKEVEDWLPDVMAAQVEDENPSLDMRALQGHPGKMWVRVNQVLPTMVAAKILQLVNEYQQTADAAD